MCRYKGEEHQAGGTVSAKVLGQWVQLTEEWTGVRRPESLNVPAMCPLCAGNASVGRFLLEGVQCGGEDTTKR